MELVLMPCDGHRDYAADCERCREREKKAYWDRQHRLAKDEKRA